MIEFEGTLKPVKLEKPARCCGSAWATFRDGLWRCACGATQAVEEFYFRLVLTENEHDCVKWDMYYLIEEIMGGYLFMNYYRKLKRGHVPTVREVKVSGTRRAMAVFQGWMRLENLFDYLDKDSLEKGVHPDFFG